MADVFISYSRRDEQFAARLAGALEELGKNVWRDRDDIGPATAWRDEIQSGIDASDVFTFVLTPDSLASRNCGDELARAVQAQKTIVPVLRRDPDGVPVPDELSRLNYVLARDQDDFGEAVEQLRAAIDGLPEWERMHSRLLTRASEWDARGRDRSRFLRGGDLREAEAWSAERPGDRHPTPLELAYLLASRRSATRRQRTVVGLALAAVAALSVLALVAVVQRNTADQQRREATRQRDVAVHQTHLALSGSLAAQSAQVVDRRLDLGALEALEAYRQAPTVDARSAIVAALERADRVEAILPGRYVVIATGGRGRWLATLTAAGVIEVLDLDHGGRPVGMPIRTHQEADFSLAMAVAPDGLGVVVSSGFHTQSWSAVDGTRGPAYPFVSETLGAELNYAPDGRTLAIGNDRGIALYAVGRHPRLRWRDLFHNGIQAQAYDPHGGVIAGADYGGDVRRWRARGGEPRRGLHPGTQLSALAYSPSGRVLASGSGLFFAGDHNGLAVWDPARRPPSRALSTRGMVNALAFARERTLVVLDGTRTETVDLGAGQLRLQPLSPYAGSVNGLYPGRPGRFVTLGADGVVRLWSLDQPAALRTVVAAGHPVTGVAVSADGRLAAALDDQGDVILRDARSGAPAGAPIPSPGVTVTAIAFAGDRTIVTGGNDGRLRFTNLDRARPQRKPRRLVPPDSGVGALAASADGRRVASSSGAEGFVDVVDVAGRRPRNQHGLDGVGPLAFASDSKTLAVVKGGLGTRVLRLRLWDVLSGRPVKAPFTGASLASTSVLAFSPDRRLLASGGERDVQLWDVRGRRASGEPLHVGGTINGLSFSPDSRTLAVASTTGVSLWDVQSRSRLGDKLTTDDTSSIAFGSGGRSLVSGDRHGISFWNPLLWTRDIAAIHARLCQVAGRQLTPAEWRALLPRQPYRKTC